MKHIALWVSLLALLGAASCCVLCVLYVWSNPAELELEHNVNSDFVTPHTDWAVPYALGKTRVLFFVSGHETEPREVIELKQRFDFESQMVFWSCVQDTANEGWHGDKNLLVQNPVRFVLCYGKNGTRRIKRLLSQKWDAFVFLGIPLKRLSRWQQDKLLKAVAGGAGLVLAGVDDTRVLKAENLIKTMPAWLISSSSSTGGPPANTVGDAYTIKRGRGIRLSASPNIGYRPGWEVDYDYWQQRLGKAILWAAGKDPQVALTVERHALEVQRALLPTNEVTVKWQAPAQVKDLNLEITLRRSDGWTLSLPKIAAKTAEGFGAVVVPVVRAGDYYLDVIARSSRGVENFCTADFKVINPRNVTEIKLDQDWGEIGEKLSGKVLCAGNVSGADERLIVSLFDRRGRELMRQDVGPVANAGSFSFPIEDWLPMLVTVKAALISLRGATIPITGVEHDTEISSAWQFARVTQRHRGRFNFVMWDMPNDSAIAPYAMASRARNNVTVCLGYFQRNPPPWVAAYNIAWVPYTTRILAGKDANGIMRPSCWNDEAKIQTYVNNIVQKYVPSRRHGVFVYSLGDENDVRGSCLSPQCLAAYQNYLQLEYGDVKALNASWGANYNSFGDVQLSKPDDNNEIASFCAGNFPRWFDRRAYQSYNYGKLCERFGKGFRAIDPQSLCGFEGAGTFRAADDLDGFVRANTFWSPYPGTADEVVRSIAPRDFPRSNWMGYTKDADSLLEKYWRMVTRGCDSVWWWMTYGIGKYHGWLAPSLDPYPAVKEIMKDTQIVRDGLGDLLLQCDMQDDDVGILFSQPSAYATKVQSSPSYGGYEDDHVAWHSALRDLGLNFRYITDRQMRLGEAKLEQFKVMILPLTQAIGSKEAQLLRDYVSKGGVLIADVRPGIYDGHLKPLTVGSLDDLFGIKRTGFANAVVADAAFSGILGGLTLAANVSKIRVDGGITANGAQAYGKAGQTPLLLVNNVGKGQAILLNFTLSSYPALKSQAILQGWRQTVFNLTRADTTPESTAEVIKALLNVANVKPALTLLDSKSQRLRNVEVTRWQNGGTEIVSIFRHAGTPEAARMVFGDNVQVYDLKNHNDLGVQKAFELTITPCRAQFFAISKQPLTGAEVSVKKTTVMPGSVLVAKVSVPKASGQQAVKLRVKLPDGQVADWLDQVVVTDRKGATVEFPIAYNDPCGTWTITATELFTHHTDACRFTVK